MITDATMIVNQAVEIERLERLLKLNHSYLEELLDTIDTTTKQWSGERKILVEQIDKLNVQVRERDLRISSLLAVQGNDYLDVKDICDCDAYYDHINR